MNQKVVEIKENYQEDINKVNYKPEQNYISTG